MVAVKIHREGVGAAQDHMAGAGRIRPLLATLGADSTTEPPLAAVIVPALVMEPLAPVLLKL